MSADMLKVAAQKNDIDGLYRVIQQNPQVLEDIDSISFVDTPLHVAASLGHLQFATEIMRLKPSFGWRLNPEGWCPIHLASQHNHQTMVLYLLDIDDGLVRAKGREGLTPLHLVSQVGEIDLLREFLLLCPDSIRDVTVKSETALHIAIQNQQYEILQALLDSLKKHPSADSRLNKQILNWKNEEGNTILHLSLLRNDLQAVRLLVNSNTPIDLDAKNLENKTALDIPVSEDIKSILASARQNGIYSTLLMVDEALSSVKNIAKFLERDLTEEQRNAFIIVATLITTASYQSVLSPPGGVYQANAGDNNAQRNDAGKSIMSGVYFFLFSVFNTASFIFSIMTTFLLIPIRGYRSQMLVMSVTSWFITSYLYSLWVISPNTPSVIVCCILTSIYYLFIYIFRTNISFSPNFATLMIKARTIAEGRNAW